MAALAHIARRASARGSSVRIKLAGLVGLGMVASAVMVGTLLFATAHELFLQQARSQLERQNQATGLAIEDLTDRAAAALLISRHSASLERVFRAQASDSDRQTAVADILQELSYVQQTFSIDEICVMDAAGAEAARIVQGRAADPSELSQNEADNPFFAPAIALADGEVYRSITPYISPDTHRYVVAHATPIVDSAGQHAGILHFEIPLDWFTERVRDTSLSGASSFLLDRDGNLLAQPLLPDVAADGYWPPAWSEAHDADEPFPLATTWGPAGFRGMAAGLRPDTTGTASFSDGNNETYEVVYRPAFSGRWILATIIPHSAIFAPLAELLRNTMLLMLPLLLLGLALAVWYAARLLAPLRRLAGALRQVAAGNLDQHLGFAGADEIGQLGRAFDRMLGELRTSRTQQGQSEQALRAKESRYRQMFEGNQAVQLLVDPESGAIVDANPAACAYYGYARAELLRRDITHLNTRTFDEVRALLVQVSKSKRKDFFAQHRLASGEIRDVQVHSSPFDDGERHLLYSVVHDVTEQLRAEAALRHQALHDSLTQLPNRTLLYDRLDHAVAGAHQRRTFGLLLLDLDRFKEVNDSLGHHAGDVLLQEVGARLRSAVGPADTVARLGGDEFAILVADADAAAASLAADRLMEVLGDPVQLEQHEVEVGGSIGIAMYPEHGDNAKALMRHADIAMYRAKRDHSGYALFTPEQDQAVPGRLALAAALRKAIGADELTLYYQPKVDCRSGKLAGVEALIRWEHPELGMIQPDQFITLAEQVGLIKPLTRWVLDSALHQWHNWAEDGLRVPIAVNLSAHDVQDEQLPGVVADLLDRWNVPASSLKLEITESALVADPWQALRILSQLCATGVRVAIDDFGTGYSSLAYLKQLPIHEIKVDRTFVRDMTTQTKDLAIVRSTIELGHNLGLEAVAEGVEDQATLDLLGKLGCDVAQGYHLSRPLPPQQLFEWCRETLEADDWSQAA
jgi:diguanylate cyclase (GGDEF)-like protein/PAS domain S-box-containing protein